MRKLLLAVLLYLSLGSSAFAAAARVTIVSDAFPQGDENPLSSSGTWRSVGIVGFDEFQVVSNHIEPSAIGATNDYISINTIALPADQWVESTCSNTSGAGNYCGVIARWAPSGTASGYVCALSDGGDVLLNKWVAGVQSTIASAAHTFLSGDILRLEVIGTSQSCYVNDALLVSGGDSSHASGNAGVEGYPVAASSDVYQNDFSAGRFGSAAATQRPIFLD